MTRWVAVFEDDPSALAVREEFTAHHLSYLDANRDAILLPGGLRPAPGHGLEGALWVIEAEGRETAAALCENDPFFRHGLRKSYRLYVWGKAFPERAVTL